MRAQSQPHQIFFTSPLRSGTASVEAWGNDPDTEIVAHPYIVYPDQSPSNSWVLSHRRTGLKLDRMFFVDRANALAFAKTIERLPGFKLVGVKKLEDGPQWDEVDQLALRKQVETLYEEFCATGAP